MAENAAPAKSADDEKRPIIVKKIKKGGGHHGGAWKVAYADFVTAMMAFFLLLWLLNVTTDEQKNAISNYFDPTHPKVSDSASGAGGVLGGLSMAPQGAMATSMSTIGQPPPSTTVNQRTMPKTPTHQNEKVSKQALEKAKEQLRKEEERKFKEIEQQIKQAINEDPELTKLAKNLIVDMTPEGLRIQIVDQEGKPMFASGSAQPLEHTVKLMTKVAKVIQKLPNELSIRGHTDSVPYGANAAYTNWELSADRANASRRILLEAGTALTRINNVVGKADTDHLVPEKPTDAKNRRISIILLKEELTNANFNKKAADKAEDMGAQDDPAPTRPIVPVGTFRKTPGAVEFP